MTNTSRILDALAKLDKENAAHWTSDGLPRIETVRLLASDQTISREDITKASPGFSRSAVALTQDTPVEQEAAPPVVNSSETGPTQGDGPQAGSNNATESTESQATARTDVEFDSGTEGLHDDMDIDSGMDDLSHENLEAVAESIKANNIPLSAVLEELDKAKERLDHATQRVAKAKAHMEEMQAQVDAITTIVARLQPNNAADAISGYLAQQRRNIDARVAQHAELVTAGYSAKDAARVLAKMGVK